METEKEPNKLQLLQLTTVRQKTDCPHSNRVATGFTHTRWAAPVLEMSKRGSLTLVRDPFLSICLILSEHL